MTDKTDSKERDLQRIAECAARLVEHADFQLGGVLSADSKARDIPSRACSQVKARHLAALRDALAGRASLAASAGSEPVATDGWLHENGLLYRLTDERHPCNRDEINVTMADGSRSIEARSRRALELLDRIRATHPSPPEGMVGGWLSITGTLCSMGNIGEEDLAAISPETPRITLQVADGSVVHIVGLSREHVGGMAPQFYNQVQLVLSPPPTTSAGSGKGD